MTILHDHMDSSTNNKEFNNSTRTVLLHQHVSSYNATFIMATFDTSSATIIKMHQNSLPEQIYLTGEQTDAFVTAWTQFKADVQATKATEE